MTYEPKTHRTNPMTGKAFCGRSDVDITLHGMATCKKCSRLEDAHYQGIIDALKADETNRAEHQDEMNSLTTEETTPEAETLERDQAVKLAEWVWLNHSGLHTGMGLHGALNQVKGCKACDEHLVRVAQALLGALGIS